MTIRRTSFLATLLVLSMTLPAAAQPIAVESGQSIAFLGDSITQAGANRPTGYCNLVIRGLASHGAKVTMIPAGISGHKSNQMLVRLEKDVLQKKPHWMTLSCGVNDVWHGEKGVPLPQYKANITAIVERVQAAGIKVMILTSTMITEDQKNPLNQKLADYNAFLRELAKEKACVLADLNLEMQAALASGPTDPRGTTLTTDGVHMNGLGNTMMALGVLRGFGLSDEQLAACRADFEAIPGSCSVRFDTPLSAVTYRKLQGLAAAKGMTVEQLLAPALNAKIEELLTGK